MRLAGDAASDYDPEGDNKESDDATRNAIDGNPTTNWNTETYQGGFEGNDKSGVGIYVDAGKPIAARLALVPPHRASGPGSTPPRRLPANIQGWVPVSADQEVGEEHTFRLGHRASAVPHYLLWITELPEQNKAEIQELSLLK